MDMITLMECHLIKKIINEIILGEKLTFVKYFIKFFKLRNIILIKDDIDNLENHKKKFKKISLIYIDCDLYKTTKNILNTLAPKVSKGGLIVFDEGNQGKFTGESKALNEFYKKNKKIQKISIKKNYQPDVFFWRK